MSELKVGISPGVQLLGAVTGDGPPVVLVHGLYDHRRIWDGAVARLARRHRVWTYDQRGHGESRGPWAGYRLEQLADDLEEVLRTVGTPAWVVGHSLGGLVAQEVACRGRIPLAGLVLVGTWPGGPLGGELDASRMASRLRGLSAQQYRSSVLEELEACFGRRTSAEMRRFLTDMETSSDPQVVAAVWESMAVYPHLGERLGGVGVDALVVAGSDDRATPPTAAIDLWGLLPRGSLCLLEGAGHFVMLDAPAEFHGLLEGFLEARSDVGSP